MKFFTRLLKPKNALRLLVKTKEMIEHLKKEWEGLDLTKLKFNADLIERVCCLVESEFDKNIYKVDKKDKVFEILAGFIALSEEDKRVIGDLIEHLHATGRIRAVSTRNVLRHSFSKVFLSK